MEDDVPQEEKERRNQVLLAELEKINASNNNALIGQEFELLAEGPSKRNAARWSGRTDTFKQVIFDAVPGMKE
ncbi:MAG: tRNA (N6-isopentenyl adenosine(37)-C2)-methylthiotransferase MiaB, partial [Lentisphaeria bacterium]|nr:tRNA (N6-isopentenyl adenosine(37)-C2)-methylthiotransferase MiaB [Lentisphaeria bacterium]